MSLHLFPWHGVDAVDAHIPKVGLLHGGQTLLKNDPFGKERLKSARHPRVSRGAPCAAQATQSRLRLGCLPSPLTV